MEVAVQIVLIIYIKMRVVTIGGPLRRSTSIAVLPSGACVWMATWASTE